MSKSSIALSAESLTLGYVSSGKNKERNVLASGLNLELHKGKLTCLLGRNGCGKSTLLKTLAGLQEPIEGSVQWEKKSPDELTPRQRARELALVLTSIEHTGNMTVEELIRLGRYPYTDWYGTLRDEDKKAVSSAIEQTGSESLLDRSLLSLSDGERQRVMIARALAQETGILLLDEPTAFLDLPGRARLMLLLARLAKERGLAILLSTHDLSLAMEAADEFWLMEDKQNFHIGTPTGLIEKGTLQRVFEQDGITFHPDTGQLQLRKR